MVPMLRFTSSRLMPMPVSRIVSFLAVLSTLMSISSSASGSTIPWSVRERKRILSRASEALETSSRRNTSLSV